MDPGAHLDRRKLLPIAHDPGGLDLWREAGQFPDEFGKLLAPRVFRFQEANLDFSGECPVPGYDFLSFLWCHKQTN